MLCGVTSVRSTSVSAAGSRPLQRAGAGRAVPQQRIVLLGAAQLLPQQLHIGGLRHPIDGGRPRKRSARQYGWAACVLQRAPPFQQVRKTPDRPSSRMPAGGSSAAGPRWLPPAALFALQGQLPGHRCGDGGRTTAAAAGCHNNTTHNGRPPLVFHGVQNKISCITALPQISYHIIRQNAKGSWPSR